MSFISKVKNILGIGGVKMQLEVPSQLPKNSSTITGKITLSSQSDQHVSKVEVKLTENWSYGRGEDKAQKSFVLGEQLVSNEFDLKAGETKTFNFALEFSFIKSENDRMKDQGGVTKTLGSMGSFLDGEKSAYTFNAFADVKGVLLIPSKDVTVKFI